MNKIIIVQLLEENQTVENEAKDSLLWSLTTFTSLGDPDVTEIFSSVCFKLSVTGLIHSASIYLHQVYS